MISLNPLAKRSIGLRTFWKMGNSKATGEFLAFCNRRMLKHIENVPAAAKKP
jgi:hypothetical protein